MIKLPPSSFPYERYDGATIPYKMAVASTEKYLEWLRTQNIIGYIEGAKLEVRIKTDTYAVLIEDEDFYQSWAHVPDDIWEIFLKE